MAERDIRRETLTQSGAVVGLAAAVSRILGFVRDVLVAAALGAHPAADALFVALRLPNLVRRILSEGGLNSAIVPVEARLRAESGEKAARAFAGAAIACAAIGSAAVLALGLVFAPALVRGLAAGFSGDAERFGPAVDFTRLALPLAAAVTVAAVVGALLAARGRFVAAALSPVVVNLVVVVVLLWLTGRGLDAVTLGTVVAVALSVAGVVQLAIVLVALAADQDRPTLGGALLTPSVRRSLALAGPGLLTAASAQLALLAALQLASRHDGAVAHLHYADRIYQLPLGFVAAGAGVVLASGLARSPGDARRLLSRGLSHALLLSLPAAAALMLLAPRIVGVLFERGAFGAADTAATAILLAGLAAGLPAAAAARVLAQPFLARERPGIPVAGALAAVLVTVAVGLASAGSLGPAGVGWAVAAGAWAEVAWLLAANTATGWRPDGDLARRLGACVLATAAMVAALWGLSAVLPDSGGMTARGLALAGHCATGLSVFAVAAWVLGAVRHGDFRTPG